jgi:hypothetical protein
MSFSDLLSLVSFQSAMLNYLLTPVTYIYGSVKEQIVLTIFLSSLFTSFWIAGSWGTSIVIHKTTGSWEVGGSGYQVATRSSHWEWWHHATISVPR